MCPSVGSLTLSVMLQVSHDVLSPHVSELVKVLLECFKDDSWPVRDGALLYI